MQHAVRSTALGIGATLALAAGSVCAQDVAGSFRETLTVETPLELEVMTGSGAITIREGSGSQAQIVGEIRTWRGDDETAEAVRALEANPPIELDGNRLVVGRLEDRNYRRISISYEITVPAQTAVTARTGSGRQMIAGLEGSVSATAGSGGIEVMDVDGDVEASTGSGGVELDDVRGDVRARTGSGGIRAEGIAGAFSGHAGSGSITVAQTASGTVDVTTGSGSVRIRVPEDASFQLDARAGSGSVRSEHPITVQSASTERNTLRGSVGSGGPMVRVRTGSGSIRIE